ncbi:metallophosphoesterase [Pyrococcus abyssi]|uniref:Phosphoesterase n=1 Tax=Pyrococcus abyssi (strain GE5 / Orsay) TaxID=272844 RepID=Q9V1W7_PYRAB|nr:metallophosphoesterase [Pyrococcus abyssi]CAB49231.1 Uncharacterized phosphoesterase [Pyrococcus abyssi GE5]CCE69686.1 TPA: 5'-cyclic-nucleotide phosphodiesterase [Pyrococcus abyssi GE5]
MLIGVLSDTHFPKAYFPDRVLRFFEEKKVKYIIHAGDITEKQLLDLLESVAPVIAVKGNADRIDLPEEETLKVQGKLILVLHGHNFLSLDTQNLTYKALEEDADILIFGHTHRPYYNKITAMGKEVVLLNPGSPTLPRMSEPTVAILNVGRDIDVTFHVVWKI